MALSQEEEEAYRALKEEKLRRLQTSSQDQDSGMQYFNTYYDNTVDESMIPDNQSGLIKALSSIEKSVPVQLLSQATQPILGFGDALSNLMSAGKATLTGGEYDPIKTGSGFSYELGNIAGEIAPWMLVPGGPMTRIGAGTVGGGLFRPEDPLSGAGEGAAMSIAGEAIPKVFGAGVDVAKKMIPDDVVTAVTKQIADIARKEKERAYAIVEPLFDKFGSTRIPKETKQYLSKETSLIEPYLSEGTKKGQKSFYERIMGEGEPPPTLNDLQKLQSTLGGLSREFKAKPGQSLDAATKELKNKIDSARNKVTMVLKDQLEMKSPGATKKYEQFQEKYAIPMQYGHNPAMIRALEERTAQATPRSLQKALSQSTEGTKPKISPESGLAQAIPEMQKRLSRSQNIANLPGMDTARKTLGFGSTLADLLGQSYPYLRQGYVGSNLAPQENQQDRPTVDMSLLYGKKD